MGCAVLVGALVLLAIVLGVPRAREALDPSSPPKVAAAEDFGTLLVAQYGAQDVELLTYDCDSGATPLLRVTVPDATAFLREIHKGLRRRPSTSIGDAGERLLDCERSGQIFGVASSWAGISQA